MAFAAGPYELVVTFADNSGDEVTRTYTYSEDAADYDTIITGLPATIATIAATSDDLIVGYTVKTNFNNDTIVLPASGVQNENQAILTVPLLGKPRDSGTLTIPAAKPTVFVNTSGPGANVVNTAASIVTNFVGLFVDGGLFTLSDGDFAIIAGMKGKRRHTKNNNG